MDWSVCVFHQGSTTIATLNCLPAIIQTALNWLLAFAGVVALFFILLSGFKFITSGGDAKQADSARKTLTYAILGLVLILLSFAIVNLIANITSSNLKFTLPGSGGYVQCKGSCVRQDY